MAKFSELAFFFYRLSNCHRPKYGSASNTLSFVLSMLWNVSKNSKMKYFADLTFSGTSSFYSSQPVFSCYGSELTFTKNLQCTSRVSRMAAVSTSPQSAISSLTLFTFYKGSGFHFQQYYFSFPCYTFSFCKISHRFITGSQGSNTITYSAVCAGKDRYTVTNHWQHLKVTGIVTDHNSHLFLWSDS